MENMVDFGLQLYSINDYTADDMEYAFGRIQEFYYKFVEFAGFFGKSSEEIKALLEKYNFGVIGAHVPVKEIIADFDAVVKYHKEIGNTNIVIPAYEIYNKELVYELRDFINEYQPKFEAEGMKLYFHNHDKDFKENKDGVVPFEVLWNETNVLFEVDTFWVFFAGLDPVKFMEEHKERIGLVHIKDGLMDRTPKSLGEGVAPVRACVDYALEQGWPMIVESEGQIPDGINDVKRCYKFFKRMALEASEENNG